MEREQIIRDDFATVRKGWDPDAVRSHLRSVADSLPQGPPAEASLGEAAAGRIRGVLEAAEQSANEIKTSARDEADLILTGARAESEQLISGAREDAEAHVTEAKQAVSGLVEQAESLRAQVDELGARLAATRPSASATSAEVPGPVIVPEPTPPTIPEPTPDPVPEPTPDPTPDPLPEPTPDPTPEPPAPDLPDEPGPLEPPVPEPSPTPPAAEQTNDDLIAQLRAGSPAAPKANGSGAEPPAVSGSVLGAARLVAMNMALEGASREQIETRLRADFGQISDLDDLLGEVLARAAR